MNLAPKYRDKRTVIPFRFGGFGVVVAIHCTHFPLFKMQHSTSSLPFSMLTFLFKSSAFIFPDVTRMHHYFYHRQYGLIYIFSSTDMSIQA